MIEWLARDLRTAFPDMKRFSRANLVYMRVLAGAWPTADAAVTGTNQHAIFLCLL